MTERRHGYRMRALWSAIGVYLLYCVVDLLAQYMKMQRPDAGVMMTLIAAVGAFIVGDSARPTGKL